MNECLNVGEGKENDGQKQGELWESGRKRQGREHEKREGGGRMTEGRERRTGRQKEGKGGRMRGGKGRREDGRREGKEGGWEKEKEGGKGRRDDARRKEREGGRTGGGENLSAGRLLHPMRGARLTLYGMTDLSLLTDKLGAKYFFKPLCRCRYHCRCRCRRRRCRFPCPSFRRPICQ